MATLLRGISGGISGKVGNVIGSKWRGIDYIRSIAPSISNPQTIGQLDHRMRFSLMGKFLGPLCKFLRIGFRSKAVKMSGFNAAMSYNLANAITGIYPAYEVDFAKVLVSKGPLPGALNPEFISSPAGKISFTWEDNSTDTGASANDLVLLVVYNPVKQKAVTIIGGNTRVSGNQTVTVPSNFTGDEVQCYISFGTAKLTVISNSKFVGGVIVS